MSLANTRPAAAAAAAAILALRCSLDSRRLVGRLFVSAAPSPYAHGRSAVLSHWSGTQRCANRGRIHFLRTRIHSNVKSRAYPSTSRIRGFYSLASDDTPWSDNKTISRGPALSLARAKTIIFCGCCKKNFVSGVTRFFDVTQPTFSKLCHIAWLWRQ